MPGGADSGIDLAVDRGGKAIAVWTAYGTATADVRPAGGAWAPRQALSAGGASFPVVSLNAAGDASAVWQRTASDYSGSVIEGSTRAQGADWTPARELSSWGSVGEPAVAESPAGEGVAVWDSFDGRNSTVAWSAHDVTPPSLTLGLPGSATASTAASFSATTSDRWSDVGTVTWDFGDGTTGAGAAIAHAFPAPGAYTVTASVTDAAGNSATRSGTVSVAPAPSPPSAPSPPPTVGTVGGVTVGIPGATPATTPRPTTLSPAAARRLPRLRIAVAVPRLRAGARGIATIRLNRALRGALVRVQVRRGLAYRTIASGRVSGRRIPVALSFSRPGRYLVRVRITEAHRRTANRVVAVTVRRR
jgi:hypothetical protein